MSKSISLNKVAFGFLCALVFSALTFGQSIDLKTDLRDSFKKFNLVRLDGQAALQKVESRQSLTIPTADKIFELNLTPRDLRVRNYQAEETTADGVVALEKSAVTTYKGKITGQMQSEVRLTIDGVKIEGYFSTASGERFFIEPAQNYSRFAGAEDFVVYLEKDSLRTDGFVCHTELGEKIERGREMVGISGLDALPPLRVLELATEADFAYVNALGGAAQANSEILSILNMIEGDYETELGLTFDVVFQHAWSTADPFDGTNSSTVLRSFQNYWNVTYPLTTVPRDAAHIWTGRPNLTGQGLSFVGVICSSPNAAYGLTGRINFPSVQYVLSAHEIGHNFNAGHVDVTQGCANTIMNMIVSNLTPLDFCQFSRTEITNFVAANGSCLSPRVSNPTLFDFDGDGKSDVSVFRPTNGAWYLNQTANGFTGLQFGLASDKLVPADYDGDGRTDVAVYRSGIWYLQRSTAGFTGIAFGEASDIPQPADYDSDGKADLAVFRPSNGVWYLQRSTAGFTGVQFGQVGDKPVAADYDGDGQTDIAVYRAGTWYLQRSRLGFTGVGFGDGADTPVPADYDGDGLADVAVFRPSNGTWYLQRSQAGFTGVAFGERTDIPAAADFDGDRRADIAVFRPSNGTWYLQRSRDGFTGVQFGLIGDVPIQSAYVR